VGHNGEAAPRVCVPANEVSDLIFLLGDIQNYRLLSCYYMDELIASHN